ncbi:MAG: response regulator, partial [Planctomycetota bacterium]
NRIVTSALLKSLGVRHVSVACDGVEAIKSVQRAAADTGRRQHPFDLVLMDYSMPVASGADVCRDLRARFGDAIPVIGFTASAHPDVVEECLGAGMQDVLPKPIRIDVLAGAVARTLQA